jgi:hypothetical protein
MGHVYTNLLLVPIDRFAFFKFLTYRHHRLLLQLNE